MLLPLNPLRAKSASKLIPVALLILLLASVCSAQSSAKQSVLNACAKVFGASIDTELNLFEVSPSFTLQPKFDDHDNLTVLSVFPKYWLAEAHPEWSEPPHWPLFTPAEFQDLLTRLDEVVGKGKLLEPGTGGVVTNSTSYFLDKYEHAYVHHGNVLDDARFVHVYPFHEINGKARKVPQDKLRLGSNFYRITVGDATYFVERDQYRKLKRGRTQKILVVGPMKGY